MQHGNQVGAVVHGDNRPVIKRCAQVAIIGFIIFSLDRINRYAIVLNQGGGDIILGLKRIGRAENHVGPAGFERLNQIGRFSRDVQAS